MRLIDADALMEYCGNQKSKTVDRNDIARFPTAQPQTGHWKPIEDSDCWRGYICDKCGKAVNQRENFCPHCGAKMVTE